MAFAGNKYPGEGLETHPQRHGHRRHIPLRHLPTAKNNSGELETLLLNRPPVHEEEASVELQKQWLAIRR